MEIHLSYKKIEAWSYFWQDAPKLPFVCMHSENMPNSLIVCQIATIVARVYTVAVAEHDGDGSI